MTDKKSTPKPEEPLEEEFSIEEAAEEAVIVEASIEETLDGEFVPETRITAAVTVEKAKRPDGVTLIAIYQFIMALPGLLLGLLIIAIPVPAVAMTVYDTIGLTAAMFGLGLVVQITAGSSMLMILSGVGLLFRWNWARWLAIAIAMVSLLVIPVGTVIGGVIIFYLLTNDVRRVFEA